MLQFCAFQRDGFAMRLTLIILLGLLYWPACAEDFPEPYNSERDLSVPLISAPEATQKLQLPPGFKASLFAAEPDVQNPIAMTWDSRGRLWIAENYTYAERQQKFDFTLRDRVLIFEDVDGDGRFDKRTVFTEDVQMLTSIEVGHGGVWLMCPPRVLFIPDANLDDKPDGPAQVMLDGFTVATENYHNFANGLRWGPDGWLYGRCGASCPGLIGTPGTPAEERLNMVGTMWRYHPLTQQVDVLTSGTTNPWGHDWNEDGECFFVNTVNGHLWHMIPGAHYVRPHTLDGNRRTYELIDMHADHWHFDTGKSWTASRAGAANEYGGGHAHIGTMIYLGDNWPDQYRGRLFTINMHGLRANQEVLEREGGGYVAKHGEDFFVSGDAWFRGMDLSYGPDGAVYVIDWSDTGECHDSTGVHRQSGRIFRIGYGEVPTEEFTLAFDGTHKGEIKIKRGQDLAELSNVDLVHLQLVKNEWYARQARRILTERRLRGLPMKDAIDELKNHMRQWDGSARGVRLLLTMHAVGGTNHGFLWSQLNHHNEYIRGWAIRLLTETWPLDDPMSRVRMLPTERDDIDSIIRRLAIKGRHEDSALVRRIIASTLQRLPVNRRAAVAQALASHAEDASDHNLPLLVWYGLIPVADRDITSLQPVYEESEWPLLTKLIARRITEDIERHPKAVDQLLTYTAQQQNKELQLAVIEGMHQAVRGWRKAAKPVSWDAYASAVSNGASPQAELWLRELSVLFGDGRAIEEVRTIALDDKAPIDARTSAIETLIEIKPDDLREICEPLLRDSRLNVTAARGIALYNDADAGKLLVESYRRFRAPNRPMVISLLSSRKMFARELLKAVGDGKVPRDDVSAFQIRQILTLEDAELQKLVTEVWGEMRESPKAKQEQIAKLRNSLSEPSAIQADLANGRALFTKTCAACHQLYGQGGKIGPDLTGANRGNLDYLLENIVDPSATVNRDFRMTILQLTDGRTLNGLVTERTEKTVSIRTATEMFTVEVKDIEAEKLTGLSPMPEGMLNTLTPEQIRDLIGYLRHPIQVPLPEAE
ncbi:MAG: c-type cytochrome [Planctomycetaceae bacterium]|nr:c-type cytochrome [Planctomycetaceae bacterium]